MKHELKTWPKYFEAIVDGTKTFELRKNDRNFKVGDTLILKEWEPGLIDKTGIGEKIIKQQGYTGRKIEKKVIYILEGWGLQKDYVVLALGEIINSDNDSTETILKEYAEDLYEEFQQIQRFEGKITLKDVADILQITD